MKYSKYFIVDHDKLGNSFISTSSVTPEKLIRLIADIHHDLEYDDYPNKWAMEVISWCFTDFETAKVTHRPPEGSTSMPVLLNWLQQSNASKACDYILKNEIPPKSLRELLQRGEAKAMWPIWSRIKRFLEKEEQ